MTRYGNLGVVGEGGWVGKRLGSGDVTRLGDLGVVGEEGRVG